MCCFPSITGLSADGERASNLIGLFTKIQGQTDIDSRFGQMVSKIQDWQISSLNLVHHFAQIKSIFPKKCLRKPATGIKGDFNEMKHEFLFETFGTEKRYLFRNSVAHRSFLNWNDLKSHVPFAFQLDFLETFCIW